MKIYFAPIEGITNYRYRFFHNQYYPGIDKYFIPFLKANNAGMLHKERKEVEMSNNKINAKVVPQILSKNAFDTVSLINELMNMGYDEINLNFGCPSGTVVPKGKGGGILKDLQSMNHYLKEVFENTNVKISIKLRIGLESENEFGEILNVLNQYPLEELIIHPRTVKDHYTGPIHFSVLDNLDKKTNFKIIYNGDIKSKEDIDYIQKNYSYIDGIMMGRGLIAHPDLFTLEKDSKIKLNQLRNFYYDLMNENRKAFGENNSLFYEKEIWAYLRDYFEIENNLLKKLNKCKKSSEMDEIVNTIFNTCPIKPIENGIRI